MAGPTAQPDPSIAATSARLAALLTAGGEGLRDPGGSGLVFADSLCIRPLSPAPRPADVWAVDGGQGLVADARSVQVYVTRTARVRWRQGCDMVEEAGPVQAHLLGLGEEQAALGRLDAPVAAGAPVDINVLRDWAEWRLVSECVSACDPGGVVLVDGDLQPDWRIPSNWLAALLTSAATRGVTLVGVTKHSSLSWGRAPLLGQLEQRAEVALGRRARWWAPVARTRPDVEPGIQVVVARLDPDARFSFRVDLPGDITDPARVLGSLCDLADDAAFPGYPYPLSVVDRLAACGGWVREEAWDQIRAGLDRAGVPADVQERAFADRHRLMERG
jgi:hypothetical protein